mgnify:CR=1 FL=1
MPTCALSFKARRFLCVAVCLANATVPASAVTPEGRHRSDDALLSDVGCDKQTDDLLRRWLRLAAAMRCDHVLRYLFFSFFGLRQRVSCDSMGVSTSLRGILAGAIKERRAEGGVCACDSDGTAFVFSGMGYILRVTL